MPLIAVALLAQLAIAARTTAPVLSFPEAGLDDSVAYRRYQTRFFRDAAANTLQIYLDGREGRVVHLLADADDASVGFTARTADGQPAQLRWGGPEATVSRYGRTRTLTHRLVADAPRIAIGAFLLGSMRVERDFQYGKHQRDAFSARFIVPELERLVAAIARLPVPDRDRQLAILGARDLSVLRARLRPTVRSGDVGEEWQALLLQPSLDGRDTMTVRVRIQRRTVEARSAGDSITLRARVGDRIPFSIQVTTTGRPLTPLSREQIFTPAFVRFLAGTGRRPSYTDEAPALRRRWLERETRGMELLASREKLMAGLPTYATYFGRDMLVTALMMRPIWRPEMSEFVIASVLRKLGPNGDVSHEEALGGQAVREAATEYASLVDSSLGARRDGATARADSLLLRATSVLRTHRRVRENYHMIDDEFQLPVLVGRWITDSSRSPAAKRAFLLDSADGGGTRLSRLLRELALVTRMTEPYTRTQDAASLISFPARDSARWSSASWRDSDAGYGHGRYAMDVNAIWAPHALEAIANIVGELRALGLGTALLNARAEDVGSTTPLGRYVRDGSALDAAVATWAGASQHFVVRLTGSEVRTQVAARMAAMPERERQHWASILGHTGADRDSLSFLAVSLDARGRPIRIANSDPATLLFLGAHEPGYHAGVPAGAPAKVPHAATWAPIDATDLFTRAYPVGLFIDRVGPAVANDAYAPAEVWQTFERDPYHGPRVIWGREVNLFLLGASRELQNEPNAARATALRSAIARVSAAVRQSGFRSELWSYEFAGGAPSAVRYGSGSDLQLWSISDLAVQFALSMIRP